MSNHHTFIQSASDAASAALKASPPVAVSGLTIAGVHLSSWVLALTAVYTAFQLYFLLRDKWWRERKGKQ